QYRRRVARPAAEPGRGRQLLVEVERGAGADPGPRREQPGGAHHQIILVQPGYCSRLRPANRQRQIIGRLDGDPIADIGEDYEAVEPMIAVRPPPQDVEIEVDLGRGKGSDDPMRNRAGPSAYDRRPRESGGPGQALRSGGPWIPAFAGMTIDARHRGSAS